MKEHLGVIAATTLAVAALAAGPARAATTVPNPTGVLGPATDAAISGAQAAAGLIGVNIGSINALNGLLANTDVLNYQSVLDDLLATAFPGLSQG
ncbi:hypothetical protein ACIRS1_34690 [Kitasatospora sp. NPDC101176]|uniref:hypothetical protein n=1 Tax=Kitasatospora sp. NPDC101176 TaxID=3364099 RepID=UPI00380D0C1C